jgi:uncharacterized membrane protein
MLYYPLLLLHISGATVGLLAGAMAMILRKGSTWHAAAGNVFFVAMLTMTTSAAYLAAFIRPNHLNLVAALLTLYLVATGWRTARHRDGGTGVFDRVAFGHVLMVSVTALTFGFRQAIGPKRPEDMPTVMYFVFGTVALFFAVSDVRMLRRGAAVGAERIARHLWRMCLALLLVTASFYPGQAKLFSKSFRATSLPYIPHILLIGAMAFWMVRIGRRKRAQRSEARERADETSVSLRVAA